MNSLEQIPVLHDPSKGGTQPMTRQTEESAASRKSEAETEAAEDREKQLKSRSGAEALAESEKAPIVDDTEVQRVFLATGDGERVTLILRYHPPTRASGGVEAGVLRPGVKKLAAELQALAEKALEPEKTPEA
jgi:hypothetical protein